MTRRSGLLVVATVLLAGCGASNHPRQSESAATSTHQGSPIQSIASSSKDDPCRLITADVIAIGNFDVPVSNVTDARERYGSRLCVYGDNPNPNELSISSLILGDEPPAALNSRHVSARQEALFEADLCVHGSLVQLGPSGGIGSFAAFCVGTPGSVRGGWVQRGHVFSMSYFTPSEAMRSIPDRLAHFAEIASVISREIG